MPTLKQRILELLARSPGLTDREITDRLEGREAPQQPVNIACRGLEKAGALRRARERADSLIGNYPTGRGAALEPPSRPRGPSTQTEGALSEDEVKKAVADWLLGQGWTVEVAWGQARGIDILARRGHERWVIEAKGSGSLQPMRVNYFLAILGTLLQRMDDPAARYSIALPDMRQFRGLWQRLPALAKHRTGITALFVAPDGSVAVGDRE